MTQESIQSRAVAWAAGKDTGVSSKTIMAFMLYGEVPDPGYPHDSDDLGRCLRLLEKVPEWESRLPDMAKIPGLDGQVWGKLAGMWFELKGVYDTDKQLCTRMIKSAIEPLASSSGEVARIGKGMSVRGRKGTLGGAIVEHANKDLDRNVPKGATKAQRTRLRQAQADADAAVEGFKNALDGKDENTVDNTSDVGGVAGKRLKAFVERIERLEQEKSALGDDIKDVYAECKGVGFDVKTVRKILRLRKMDAEKRREEDELLELYKSAIGLD